MTEDLLTPLTIIYWENRSNCCELMQEKYIYIYNIYKYIYTHTHTHTHTHIHTEIIKLRNALNILTTKQLFKAANINPGNRQLLEAINKGCLEYQSAGSESRDPLQLSKNTDKPWRSLAADQWVPGTDI